jgi:hypothetical protein
MQDRVQGADKHPACQKHPVIIFLKGAKPCSLTFLSYGILVVVRKAYVSKNFSGRILCRIRISFSKRLLSIVFEISCHVSSDESEDDSIH